MPRPRKCRRVCCLPKNRGFLPMDGGGDQEPVVLTVDEYEAIRLIDKQGLSQEECGSYMNIARTTVQQIYTVARGKIAEALVEGLPLRIEGGHYQLCGAGQEEWCRNCPKRMSCLPEPGERRRGGTFMKIAIPVDEDKKSVCVSFGRAPYFLFHDVEAGTTDILENPAAQAQGGAGLKAAQFVVDNGADTLLTVRCGQNAADVLNAAEIKIYETQGLDAQSNLSACKEKKLAELTHFHAGYHGIQ